MKDRFENDAALFQSLPPEALKTLHPAVRELLISIIRRVAELEAENRVLREENRAFREEVRELRSRLGENSSNSSKPPSSDPPWVPPKEQKPPSGRQRGGQKGHRGHHRELLPPEEVDVVERYPEKCEDCNESLDKNIDDSPVEAHRHQVIDMPPVSAEIIEYQLHALKCHRCGKITRAALPEGVSWSSFGPGLQATVALLTGRYRLSRRETEEFLQDLLGVRLSLGSVSEIEQKVSDAIELPVEEAKEAMRSAPVVGVDETGWREANKRAWLWTGVTPQLAIFHIDYRRDAGAALRLLGENFQGIVNSDRWKAYRAFPFERRGICHAHLIRDFQKIKDFGGASRATGEWGLSEEERIFKMWDHFNNGDWTRSELEANLVPLRARVRRLLERGEGCGDKKTEGMCRDILRHWEALWTFSHKDGVDPTNNAAERALRKGVLWRKGSFGTQSELGSRFAERILTVTETCRRQGRRIIDFLVDAIKARITGQPAPSLLPAPGG
jgi:transposase